MKRFLSLIASLGPYRQWSAGKYSGAPQCRKGRAPGTPHRLATSLPVDSGEASPRRNTRFSFSSLFGDAGNDYLYGGYGNDTLNGSDGDDQLYGDYNATDTVNGGNDSIIGGDGAMDVRRLRRLLFRRRK